MPLRKVEKVSSERQKWVNFFQPTLFQPVTTLVLPTDLRWIGNSHSPPEPGPFLGDGRGQGPLFPEPSQARGRTLEPAMSGMFPVSAGPCWPDPFGRSENGHRV